MVNVRPKSTQQVRAIYGEAKRRGLDNDALHEIVGGSIKALSFAEAQKVIQRLKADSFVPLRTLQYRRAKAGVQQIVTDEMLTLIAELASQRKWSPETLQNFCVRQCKKKAPRTTVDANKVIEALKSMNKRKGLWYGEAA